MKLTPIQTPTLRAGQLSVEELVDAYVARIPNGCVLATSTSKVMSLCEGRVASADTATKGALVERESDWYLDAHASASRFTASRPRSCSRRLGPRPSSKTRWS